MRRLISLLLFAALLEASFGFLVLLTAGTSGPSCPLHGGGCSCLEMCQATAHRPAHAHHSEEARPACHFSSRKSDCQLKAGCEKQPLLLHGLPLGILVDDEPLANLEKTASASCFNISGPQPLEEEPPEPPPDQPFLSFIL